MHTEVFHQWPASIITSFCNSTISVNWQKSSLGNFACWHGECSSWKPGSVNSLPLTSAFIWRPCFSISWLPRLIIVQWCTFLTVVPCCVVSTHTLSMDLSGEREYIQIATSKNMVECPTASRGGGTSPAQLPHSCLALSGNPQSLELKHVALCLHAVTNDVMVIFPVFQFQCTWQQFLFNSLVGYFTTTLMNSSRLFKLGKLTQLILIYKFRARACK